MLIFSKKKKKEYINEFLVKVYVSTMRFKNDTYLV